MNETLYRLSAFTQDPEGGNPAGVCLGDALPKADTMQRIAAEVGYSETIFLAPRGEGRYLTRYYSPAREIDFCGHASVAAGVLLGSLKGGGTYCLETAVGQVPLEVSRQGEDWWATLVSVAPQQRPAPPDLVAGALECLGWRFDELDSGLPPMLAYAGVWHLVLAAASHERLVRLDYDFDALEALMSREGLTTLQLVWRDAEGIFHARNPFPVGGVVEDPATGAAAAALGGYLRDAGLVAAPASLTIIQGETMGRPSRLEVTLPEHGGIRVSGTAVSLDPGGPVGGGHRSTERNVVGSQPR